MAQKQLNSFGLPKWNTERRRTRRPSPSSSTRPVPERAHVEFEFTKDELEVLEALESLIESCPSEHQLVDVEAEREKKVVEKGKAKVENKATGSKKAKDNVGDVVKNKASLKFKLPYKKVMDEDKGKGKQVKTFERRNKDVSTGDKKAVKMEKPVEKKDGKQAEKVGSGNVEGLGTWNLRSRSKLLNANMGGNDDEVTDIMKRIKFDLCLTPKEIEDDMRTMKAPTSRRIKKRPKNLQNKLDNLVPGTNLSNITAETYNVPESRKKHG